MKFILFCQNPYAFGILQPVMQVLKEREYQYIWFLKGELAEKFPFPEEPNTSSIQDLKDYKAEAILCPGNEVPHYLRGLKVQVFHGLAGEKKGHFRIRHYFDLYLTQGPYFTKRFNELKRKHKDFEVIETGWPKLDIYGKELHKYDSEKQELLEEYKASEMVLYAPTFSPSLTSAPHLLKEMEKLAQDKNYLIIVKFHDLMDPEVAEKYRNLASQFDNIVVADEPNIIKFLLMADVLVSDTSSVVYEFLLLDKSVITFRSNSENILWDDSKEYLGLAEKVTSNLEKDEFKAQRQEIIRAYHPYNDGKSAKRMVNAVEDHIALNGVPEKRKLPILRKMKIRKMFKE